MHAYNAVISMPLSVPQRRRLLAALYAAAGQPPLEAALADALFSRGPIRAFGQLRALPRFGRRQQRRLRAVSAQPALATTLARVLQELTQTQMRLPDRRQPLPHPLGEDAGFPPQVSWALGYEGGVIYGTPRTLPGFPFGERIIHFREAVRRPVPGTALVLGGGYIGCEMALAWAEAGAAVTLIDRADTLLTAYPAEQIDRVSALLEGAGVHIRLRLDIGGCRRHQQGVVIAGRHERRSVLLAAEVLLVAVGVQHTPRRR